MIKNNLKTRDGIVYNGNVHIQYQYKSKKRCLDAHNTGYLPLFTCLVLSLGGESVEAGSYMPRYIMARGNGEAPCLKSKLLVQDRKYYKEGVLRPVDGSEADTIRYTFVIPASNMISGSTITKLQLVNELDGVCASINLTGNKEINTDIGANLLIYWDLMFADGDAA